MVERGTSRSDQAAGCNGRVLIEIDDRGSAKLELGAIIRPDGVGFRVWAPGAGKVELLLDSHEEPTMLDPEADGHHFVFVPGVAAGELYRFRVDGAAAMPDPASRFQPEGVHGPSQVIDPHMYAWRNEPPPALEQETAVIYELHVGTFSPGGDFEGVSEKLEYLSDLGVSALEIMPLADFPGRWNWGYDPASFFAPSRAYGEPDDLRRLIDEAHGRGMAVILDAVYNHLGPDGAYLPAFSPHVFTSRHNTPWGQALDFDGPHSEGLRRFVLENALMWLQEYRFDGLRLDATFAIIDEGPTHLLQELSQVVARLPGPGRLLIAEDPRNLRNIVMPVDLGGLGLDAVWADDFHHQVRVGLAGDNSGYYRDFSGSSGDIGRTIRANWFYRGHHSPAHGAPRGTPAADLNPEKFVFCIQNHDQVGNRPQGNRLHHDIPLNAYRAASALLLFVPQLPMLFMGQEWATTAPFLFFTDHEGELGKQVSEGRRREFADFDFDEEVPDPQAQDTFDRSRLDWSETGKRPHEGILLLYRDLIDLRRTLEGRVTLLEERPGGLALQRGDALLLIAFEDGVELTLPKGARVVLSTEDSLYEPEPQPPEASGGSMRFSRAAALITEVRS